MVGSVAFFDRLRIDDPVGAISVHGVCGVWGTLAAALFDHGGFSTAQLATQAIGVLAAFAWTFSTTFVLFKTLAATMGLRVSRDEELEGLDISEHASEAYPADPMYG